MTSIIPTSIANFDLTLRNIIDDFEGDVRRIYVDTKGIPTMGA